MNYTFSNISTTKFSVNGREFYKTFIAYYVDQTRIKIFNIYDSTTPLIPVTQVSEIDIDGAVYNTSTLLMNQLTDILFVREDAPGALDAAQIESNRQSIVSLQNDKADANHNHDLAYYTKQQIDDQFNLLPNQNNVLGRGDVDGDNIDFKNANGDTVFQVDAAAFRSQGTQLQYDGRTLKLINESGEELSSQDVIAKETEYDKFKFLEGLEDDLNDLNLLDRYALIKTTGGLFFFVSKSDNVANLQRCRLQINPIDEYFDLLSPNITDVDFQAWQIPVVTDNFIDQTEYGFNFWVRNFVPGVLAHDDPYDKTGKWVIGMGVPGIDNGGMFIGKSTVPDPTIEDHLNPLKLN